MDGKTLHYIDPDAETLTTLRATHLVHEPGTYAAHRLCHPLTDVLVSTKTGEFAHPGEREQARAVKEEQRRQEQARREKQKAQQRFVASVLAGDMVGLENLPPPAVVSPSLSRPIAPGEGATQPILETREEPKLICRFCGASTNDWWMKEGSSGFCRCKACASKGIYESA